MADTLTALDGTFLRLEELDERALMNLGGVMVFEPRRVKLLRLSRPSGNSWSRG
jgi:hypothetical protein